MTDAQTEALEKISQIIREHFESGIIVVVGENEREMQWHGGIASAIGLCTIAKDRLLVHARDGYLDPPDEDEVL